MIAPCEQFDYGFMKQEIQSPESPIKAPTKTAGHELTQSHRKEKILYDSAVRRMEQKTVGLIVATAVKSELEQPKNRSLAKMIEEENKAAQESKRNISNCVESIKDIDKNNQSQESENLSKAAEKLPVNYNPKIVYRYQFEASPPDWIGVWEGKTRKFGLPPNTSVLHFVFMGGVLSRLDDKSNVDQVVSAPTYTKYQGTPTVIDRLEHDQYVNKETLVSPEEYRFILVQTVNSNLYRHWRRNEDICFCKICNCKFSFFKRKHHCRLYDSCLTKLIDVVKSSVTDAH
jgi:hypothetical protein